MAAIGFDISGGRGSPGIGPQRPMEYGVCPIPHFNSILVDSIDWHFALWRRSPQGSCLG